MKFQQTPIPYAVILNFRKKQTAQEHDAACQQIHHLYGDQGLLSLWSMLCYDNRAVNKYDTPTESKFLQENGLKPAIEWWISKNNSYANKVRELLQACTIEEAKNALRTVTHSLIAKTFTRDADTGQNVVGEFHMLGFTNVDARALRVIAKNFFPQWPELATPLFDLYHARHEEQLYDDPMKEHEPYELYPKKFEAFSDDVNALKFLASLDNDYFDADLPKWLIDFQEHGDDEWNIYRALSDNPAEWYNLSVQRMLHPNAQALNANAALDEVQGL